MGLQRAATLVEKEILGEEDDSFDEDGNVKPKKVEKKPVEK